MTITQTSRDESAPVVPSWDLADRLHKSLRLSGVGVSDMAELLGVGRDTVSRWINGHNPPKRAALLAWASITNVDMSWLETGQAPTESEPDGGELRACRDSNPKPSDLYLILGSAPSEGVNAALTLNRLPGDPRPRPADRPGSGLLRAVS